MAKSRKKKGNGTIIDNRLIPKFQILFGSLAMHPFSLAGSQNNCCAAPFSLSAFFHNV